MRRWKKTIRNSAGFTLVLCLCLTPLSGAFEGAGLFRTVGGGAEGIFPPAMNNPARLPDRPLWLALGWGQPLGLPWASYGSASLGGAIHDWRGAAGVWSSGDEIYREVSLSAALARHIPELFTAGFSLVYNQVSIQDFPPAQSELLIGLGIVAPFTTSSEFSLWYAGQTLTDEQAYQSLGRQLYQLAVSSRAGAAARWTLALEKTPGYDLRQLAEFNLLARQGAALQLGYRTSPGTTYVGVQLPLRRLSVSLRVNIQPLFGLSTAIGISYK